MVANKDILQVTGKGDVDIYPENGTVIQGMRMKQVLYVPRLQESIMSISRMDDMGLTVKFEYGEAKIYDQEGKIIFKAFKENGLYYVQDEGENADRKTTEQLNAVREN